MTEFKKHDAYWYWEGINFDAHDKLKGMGLFTSDKNSRRDKRGDIMSDKDMICKLSIEERAAWLLARLH